MKRLMLASSSQERLTKWESGLRSSVDALQIKTKLINNSFEEFKNLVMTESPETLLLDIDDLGLNDTGHIANLRKICSVSDTIILGCNLTEILEWEFIKAGARGCCRSDTETDLLSQILTRVQQGELWIRRSLASRFIMELSKSASNIRDDLSNTGLLKSLTQREYDVAMRVGDGETNRQIAVACFITEGTVKGHLTEIFHKLGVADRLNLALKVVAYKSVARERLVNHSLEESTLSTYQVVQHKSAQLSD